MFIQHFRISPDGESLQLLVKIEDVPSYAGIFIDKLALGVASDACHSYPVAPRWEHVPSGDVKELSLQVPVRSLSLPSRARPLLYFLWVKARGDFSGIPCCRDKDLDTGIAVNFRPFYEEALHLFERFAEHPSGVRSKLEDLYLRKLVFQDMIENGDHVLASRFFVDYIEEDLSRWGRGVVSRGLSRSPCHCPGS